MVKFGESKSLLQLAMDTRGAQLEGEPARGLEADMEEEGGSRERERKSLGRRATAIPTYIDGRMSDPHFCLVSVSEYSRLSVCLFVTSLVSNIRSRSRRCGAVAGIPMFYGVSLFRPMPYCCHGNKFIKWPPWSRVRHLLDQCRTYPNRKISKSTIIIVPILRFLRLTFIQTGRQKWPSEIIIVPMLRFLRLTLIQTGHQKWPPSAKWLMAISR